MHATLTGSFLFFFVKVTGSFLN